MRRDSAPFPEAWLASLHGAPPRSPYRRPAVRTSEVQGKTTARHTSVDFLGFLGEVVATRGGDEEIHVILDNLSTHKTKLVEGFLDEHPSVTLHFTPTYSSWLNQVELWFSKVQRGQSTRHWP